MDFELGLNASRKDASFTWSGRLFHAVGPATEKEQSPNFVQDHGMCRIFDKDRSLSSAEVRDVVRNITIIYLVLYTCRLRIVGHT